MAEYSDKFIVIADYRKASSVLGQSWDYVPIEVSVCCPPIFGGSFIYPNTPLRCADIQYPTPRPADQCSVQVVPMAVRPVQERLAARYGGTASLRMARAKAGPVVTDNGNLVT